MYTHTIFTQSHTTVYYHYTIRIILFFVFLTLNVFLLYLFGMISHYFFFANLLCLSPRWSGRPEMNSEYTQWTQPNVVDKNNIWFLFFCFYFFSHTPRSSDRRWLARRYYFLFVFTFCSFCFFWNFLTVTKVILDILW